MTINRYCLGISMDDSRMQGFEVNHWAEPENRQKLLSLLCEDWLTENCAVVGCEEIAGAVQWGGIAGVSESFADTQVDWRKLCSSLVRAYYLGDCEARVILAKARRLLNGETLPHDFDSIHGLTDDTRIVNALLRHGITSVSELREIGPTSAMKISGLGCLTKVRKLLDSKNSQSGKNNG
jgi:hypothetical protein